MGRYSYKGQEHGQEGYKPVIGGTWEEDEIGYFNVGIHNFYVNDQQKKIFNEYSKVKEFIEESEKYVSVFYPESLFNASSLGKPFNKYWKSYFYKLSHTMSRRDRFFFSLIKLENDSGWIFKNIDNSFAVTKASNETEMSIIDENSDSEIEITLYYFIFYLERSQQEIKRNYMKVQELGAMLGGFVKAVQIVFGLMASRYSKYKRSMFVYDQLKQNLSLNKNIDQTKSTITTNNYLNTKAIREKKDLKVSFFKIMFNFCFKTDKNIEKFELFESSMKEKIDIQTLFSLSDKIALAERRINN